MLVFSCVCVSLIYIFIADNISISMYIMCVIQCLFSALSRRAGALQISIIIIIITIIIIIIKLLDEPQCVWNQNEDDTDVCVARVVDERPSV